MLSIERNIREAVSSLPWLITLGVFAACILTIQPWGNHLLNGYDDFFCPDAAYRIGMSPKRIYTAWKQEQPRYRLSGISGTFTKFLEEFGERPRNIPRSRTNSAFLLAF